jgi:hypothetical protein
VSRPCTSRLASSRSSCCCATAKQLLLCYRQTVKRVPTTHLQTRQQRVQLLAQLQCMPVLIGTHASTYSMPAHQPYPSCCCATIQRPLLLC